MGLRTICRPLCGSAIFLKRRTPLPYIVIIVTLSFLYGHCLWSKNEGFVTHVRSIVGQYAEMFGGLPSPDDGLPYLGSTTKRDNARLLTKKPKETVTGPPKPIKSSNGTVVKKLKPEPPSVHKQDAMKPPEKKPPLGLANVASKNGTKSVVNGPSEVQKKINSPDKTAKSPLKDSIQPPATDGKKPKIGNIAKTGAAPKEINPKSPQKGDLKNPPVKPPAKSPAGPQTKQANMPSVEKPAAKELAKPPAAKEQAKSPHGKGPDKSPSGKAPAKSSASKDKVKDSSGQQNSIKEPAGPSAAKVLDKSLNAKPLAKSGQAKTMQKSVDAKAPAAVGVKSPAAKSPSQPLDKAIVKEPTPKSPSARGGGVLGVLLASDKSKERLVAKVKSNT